MIIYYIYKYACFTYLQLVYLNLSKPFYIHLIRLRVYNILREHIWSFYIYFKWFCILNKYVWEMIFNLTNPYASSKYLERSEVINRMKYSLKRIPPLKYRKGRRAIVFFLSKFICMAQRVFNVIESVRFSDY